MNLRLLFTILLCSVTSAYASEKQTPQPLEEAPLPPLANLEKLPEPALENLVHHLTYDQLTRLAQTSRTLYKRLKPMLPSKLMEYWSQPLAFVGMRPCDRLIQMKEQQFGYDSIAFSPNSKFLATGSKASQFQLLPLHKRISAKADIPSLSKKNIYVLATTARHIYELIMPGNIEKFTPRLVTFSPNGEMLAGATGNTIYMWTLPSAKPIDQFKESGEIDSIAFSPNGQLLAVHGGTSIKVWDLKSHTVKTEIPATKIYSFSPDGTILAYVSQEKTVTLSITHGNGAVEKKEFKTMQEISSIALSPDNTLLAIGHVDGSIRVQSIKKGTIDSLLTGHTGPVYFLVFSPYNAVLISASSRNTGDNKIRLWDVKMSKEITSLEGNGPIALSTDGQMLAASDKNGHLCLWQQAVEAPSR